MVSVLQKLTKLLGITDDDKNLELLTIIIGLVTDRILAYIEETELPKSLEWIVVEVCIKRFHLLGSEHLNSAGVEGMSASYKTDNLLNEYKEFLDSYIATKETPKQATVKKVRLLWLTILTPPLKCLFNLQ